MSVSITEEIPGLKTYGSTQKLNETAGRKELKSSMALKTTTFGGSSILASSGNLKSNMGSMANIINIFKPKAAALEDESIPKPQEPEVKEEEESEEDEPKPTNIFKPKSRTSMASSNSDANGKEINENWVAKIKEMKWCGMSLLTNVLLIVLFNGFLGTDGFLLDISYTTFGYAASDIIQIFMVNTKH